jgi:hypothetical protein
VAVLAAVVPARRAAAVDPTVALREESRRLPKLSIWPLTRQDGVMWLGINAGFGAPLGPALDFIESIGFHFVRQEFRGDANDRHLTSLLSEFVGRRTKLLALLGGGTNRTRAGGRIEPQVFASSGARLVHVAAALGLDPIVEIGNEPDIGHPGYASRPADFAAAVSLTHAAMRREGFRGAVITGGISNLSRERLDYLAAVVRAGIPADVIVGFHRYPHGLSARIPHPGFADRDAEWNRLLDIAGSRDVACTEVGHHTAPRGRRRFGLFGRRHRLTAEDAARDLMFDLEFFRDRGALMTAVYQLNDGPHDRSIDRYGIRDATGRPKPVVGAIQAFVKTSR